VRYQNEQNSEDDLHGDELDEFFYSYHYLPVCSDSDFDFLDARDDLGIY
jgi:hypothetical protein